MDHLRGNGHLGAGHRVRRQLRHPLLQGHSTGYLEHQEFIVTLSTHRLQHQLQQFLGITPIRKRVIRPGHLLRHQAIGLVQVFPCLG